VKSQESLACSDSVDLSNLEAEPIVCSSDLTSETDALSKSLPKG
jgi:hypothetical protein